MGQKKTDKVKKRVYKEEKENEKYNMGSGEKKKKEGMKMSENERC